MLDIRMGTGFTGPTRDNQRSLLNTVINTWVAKKTEHFLNR